MHTYMIRKAGGSMIVRQEPVVGRWYAGMDKGDDGLCVAGLLARYEGDGIFSDEDSDPDSITYLMGEYDFLQEQR